ncbi:MAG: YggS family pyridoxal phosphate-dependent enzyme [Pirellulales bacterium]|nr:YggS family pyridoxal phosphate-dependent enzyme [Pirellulales bacterium]
MTCDSRAIIADNIAQLRDEIAQAATDAGRKPGDVRLVAVSKYVDAATTALVLAAGCADLGESRPQKLWDKADDPALAGARWHLVGHLQRNKLRRTLAFGPLLHGVDSERLLAALEEEAAAQGITAQALLQVNCSGEAAKSGFAPEDLTRALEFAATLPRVEIRGLMTMAALGGNLATARRNFAALRELRDREQARLPAGISLAELSMGMSDDFPAAIAEGATLVRVGSRLFQGLS